MRHEAYGLWGCGSHLENTKKEDCLRVDSALRKGNGEIEKEKGRFWLQTLNAG